MKAANLVVFSLLLACGHARTAQPGAPAAPDVKDAIAPAPAADVRLTAARLSDETHALLRAEAEALWTRYTTGAGPLPSEAIAAHPQLTSREALQAVTAAADQAQGEERRALSLLRGELEMLVVAREAAKAIDALEKARAQIVFAAPGEQRPEHGERELERLLAEEPAAARRGAIAAAEAKAASGLGALAQQRDEAVARAVPDWARGEQEAHGLAPGDLAALAEATLTATQDVAQRAVAAAAVRNLGVTVDRVRRADLPRLVRAAAADSAFAQGAALGRAASALPLPKEVRVDAEPSPSKGARPLALLVDPPTDVRLSLRPAGGFEEQRATLHEAARAAAGAQTRTSRWELAQLGDGAAAEAVAQLYESLAGDPAWLRDVTPLRGEPLDDLVHTQIARRLLDVRRAAALVLFEVKRREGPQTPESLASLYRGLLQRATFAVYSDEDAARWPLEADLRLRAQLPAALLAAELEQPDWWKAPREEVNRLWRGGRSLNAPAAAQLLGLQTLGPAALVRVAEARLAYKAPDAPPPVQKPDYKYMQGDKKKRRRKHR